MFMSKGRKVVSLILALIMAVASLTACSASGSGSSNTSGSTNSTEPAKEQKSVDFPKKPVTIIVPFSAGGSADLTTRILATNAEEYLGQTIIVENAPGGGGMVGQNKGAQAKPDGYTLTTVTTSVTINPLLNEAPFTVDDFRGIIQLTEETDFLVIQSGKEYTNFEEFIAYAKKNPNTIKFGCSGKGTTDDLANEAMIKSTGISASNIPFDGSGLAITAILGGHVDAIIGGPSSFDNHIKEGTLIPIASLTEERNSMYPDVPSIKELGYDVYSGAWRGIAAPQETPDEVVQILHEAFKKAMEDPEYIEQMTNSQLSVNYLSNEDFSSKIISTYEMYKGAIGK